jgi:hypothetical protein
VALGGVGAHQQEHVGVVNVLIAAHGLVLAVGGHVATHRRSHAQPGVAIHVVGADAGLEELVGYVGFFGQALAGAVKRHRIRPVLFDSLLEPGGHQAHGFVPGGANELAVLADHGVQAAGGRGEDLRQKEALQAQKALVVVFFVALYRKDLAVPDPNVKPAAGAAVPAHRFNPLLATRRLRRARQTREGGQRRSGSC